MVQCGELASVDCSDVIRVKGAACGIFTVLPEKRTVAYQRRDAAFATESPNVYDWSKVGGAAAGVC